MSEERGKFEKGRVGKCWYGFLCSIAPGCCGGSTGCPYRFFGGSGVSR